MSWRERTLESFFPSSFEYTPIEMNDRSLGPEVYRSNELQVDKGSASGIVPFDGHEPTEEELATLRKVADHLPWSAFIVALVELCERFTYYGLSGPFQNYIQYHPHDIPVRGGIGTDL